MRDARKPSPHAKARLTSPRRRRQSCKAAGPRTIGASVAPPLTPVRRVRKISNAHIFEPTVAREIARHRLLDEILSFFGGRALPMMAQLVDAGRLSRADV